jgi:hypothetical protein
VGEVNVGMMKTSATFFVAKFGKKEEGELLAKPPAVDGVVEVSAEPDEPPPPAPGPAAARRWLPVTAA